MTLNNCNNLARCQAVQTLLVVTADRGRPPARPAGAAPAFPLLSSPLRRRSSGGPVVVYLLVNADGEDIPVLQRLLTKHQPMVELLDWLVAPGGSVRVGQAD